MFRQSNFYLEWIKINTVKKFVTSLLTNWKEKTEDPSKISELLEEINDELHKNVFFNNEFNSFPEELFIICKLLNDPSKVYSDINNNLNNAIRSEIQTVLDDFKKECLNKHKLR